MMKTLYIRIQHEDSKKAEELALMLKNNPPSLDYSYDIQAGNREEEGLSVTTTHLGFVFIYSFNTLPTDPDSPLEVNTAKKIREEYESLLKLAEAFNMHALNTALKSEQFQIADQEQLTILNRWTTVAEEFNQKTLENFQRNEHLHALALDTQNMVRRYYTHQPIDDTSFKTTHSSNSSLFLKKPSPHPMAKNNTPSLSVSGYRLLAGVSGLIGVAGVAFALEPVAWLIGLALLSASPPAFIAVVSIYALLVAASFTACAVFVSKAKDGNAHVPSMAQ